jgi:hypothetical protein
MIVALNCRVVVARTERTRFHMRLRVARAFHLRSMRVVPS